MKKLYMGQKMIVSALAGMILIPGSVVRIQAAENEEQQSVVPTAGIESALEECYRTKVKENLQLYLVPTDEGEYLNIAFSDTDDFTYVRSEPDENSDWTGKLYKDSTVEVLEYLDGWTKIRSGETEGYVPTEKLFTGEDARIHSGEYEENTATVTADRLNVRAGTGTDTEVLTQVSEGETYEIRGEQADGWYPVKVGEINGWVYGAYVTTETSYSYGETKEQEEARKKVEAEQPKVSQPNPFNTANQRMNGQPSFMDQPKEQPVPAQPELLTRAFKVTTTRENIIALGNFMNEHGIDFDKIEVP